jgi:hypothetical protein
MESNPMSANAEPENRLLNASELEIVSASRSPAIEQLPMEELTALAHRLRQAHGRAKNISEHQQRQMRGQIDPRAARRAEDNAGSMVKVRVLFAAIQRIDRELSRREGNIDGRPSQAELSRRALELKLSSQALLHPDAGRTESNGMRPKERKEPIKLGTTGKEIGRVSQAGNVAQARKDARRG